jgi:hypothetical protein
LHGLDTLRATRFRQYRIAALSAKAKDKQGFAGFPESPDPERGK